MLCNDHHYFQNFVIIPNRKMLYLVNPGEFLKGLKLDNDTNRAEMVMTPSG